jgi:hypothetical protein
VALLSSIHDALMSRGVFICIDLVVLFEWNTGKQQMLLKVGLIFEIGCKQRLEDVSDFNGICLLIV